MVPRVSLPVSLGLAGFSPGGVVSLRSQIEAAAGLGHRAVTLNAAAADGKPRDLGRSARRDLAALIRRHSMVCPGVDLWLPAEHLVQPANSQRAIEALVDAAEFAAEMAELTGATSGGAVSGRAVLSTSLLSPGVEGMGGVLDVLRDRATAAGVRVADHRWPRPAASEGGAEEPADSPLGIGIDPAGMMLAEGPLADPGAAVSKFGRRVFGARLSDANTTGRCPVGDGRVDVLGYAVALATAGYSGWAVVDVRGLRDSVAGARAGLV